MTSCWMGSILILGLLGLGIRGLLCLSFLFVDDQLYRLVFSSRIYGFGAFGVGVGSVVSGCE